MLEQAIRPWVPTGALRQNNIVADQTKVNRGRARVVWGAVGTIPTPDVETDPVDPSTYKFKLEECNDGYKESKRKTKTIKVTNPDDAEQFVMIDQIQLIAFEHTTDAKLVGSFSTETTAFADFTLNTETTGTSKPKVEQCVATYTLSE